MAVRTGGPIPAGPMEATAPEACELLSRRLRIAEEETEALVRDLDALGLGRHPKGHTDGSTADSIAQPPTPLPPLRVSRALAPGASDMLWRNYEALVQRVCRAESALHTLRLTALRLQAERELAPPDADDEASSLREEVSGLQHEVARLRHRLADAVHQLEASVDEKARLSAALEVATATKSDVAIAAEEMKHKTTRMNNRVNELRAELSREASLRATLEESHAALLDRVRDAERIVDAERSEVARLQGECSCVRQEGLAAAERARRDRERASELEGRAADLHRHAEAKESIITQMTAEGKRLQSELHEEKRERGKLQAENSSIVASLKKMQAEKQELQRENTALATAARDVEIAADEARATHQKDLQAERAVLTERIREQDGVLEAARASVKEPLVAARREIARLDAQLTSLQHERVELVRERDLAIEGATSQKDALEEAAVRLRRELDSANQELQQARREKGGMLREMETMKKQHSEEREKLEAENAKNKLEAHSLGGVLRAVEEEAGRLAGKLAASEQRQSAERQVEQLLGKMTESKNRLAYEKGQLQTRVEQLEAELLRLSAERADSGRLSRLNTALQARHAEATSELSSCKVTISRLEAKLAQLESSLETKEEEFALAVRSRDDALQEKQRIMGLSEGAQERERQKVTQLSRQLEESRAERERLATALQGVTAAHGELQAALQEAQTQLGRRDGHVAGLLQHRTQSQHALQQLTTELETLQSKLNTVETQNASQMDPARKALELSRADNTRLARALERALAEEAELRERLARATAAADAADAANGRAEQLAATREREAEEARAEAEAQAGRLTTLRAQFQSERDAAKVAEHRETNQLRRARDSSAVRCSELSRANRELRERAAALEETLATQAASLKKLRAEGRRQRDVARSNGASLKEAEGELAAMQRLRDEYLKKSEEQAGCLSRFADEVKALQEEQRALALAQAASEQLCGRQEGELARQKQRAQELEAEVARLRTCKEEMERRLQEASDESQQISSNLEEAHRWFRDKFDSLQTELHVAKRRDGPARSTTNLAPDAGPDAARSCVQGSTRKPRDGRGGEDARLQPLVGRCRAKQELRLMARNRQEPSTTNTVTIPQPSASGQE
ncbi:coiled-coil domain-containing protein 150 [Lethenteron reissneri]|uniref:coiled-coil domain-containing protein 150 n=1 Tax=Lethenteron reissneri TaxID=7753 RepID=UPI002AB76537|nr:coiled-coil domain-containing protein 150 [Lethenteron reissneri]